MTTRIAALYHFTRIADPAGRQQPLLDFCRHRGILGTLLLAEEGINGTVAGSATALAALIEYLEGWDEIGQLDVKYSAATGRGFRRMKVRLKREIVTMGKPEINQGLNAGTYVSPNDWNRLIRQPDVMVVDTRNRYETRLGRFAHAVDPNTETFRAFPHWADELAASPDRPTKVAMYCTGGIRCEKASAYMKQIGFDEVYHLRGGILKYLEDIPEQDSLWDGECFVFDERVALKHRLEEGRYSLCHACKEPIDAADRQRDEFEDGVSCHHCRDRYTDAQRDKFRERQRQIRLAAKRGDEHLGQDSASSRRHRQRGS